MTPADLEAIRAVVRVDRHTTIDPVAWRKLVAILRDLIAAPTPDKADRR